VIFTHELTRINRLVAADTAFQQPLGVPGHTTIYVLTLQTVKKLSVNQSFVNDRSAPYRWILRFTQMCNRSSVATNAKISVFK